MDARTERFVRTSDTFVLDEHGDYTGESAIFIQAKHRIIARLSRYGFPPNTVETRSKIPQYNKV